MTGGGGVVIGHSPSPILPALIAAAGDRAARRFVEYFTVNIRKRTRWWLMRGWKSAGGSGSNSKTTGLYDRCNDDISVGEVEKIGI